jgi:YidC/Oxa1 family membrane protein insertase
VINQKPLGPENKNFVLAIVLSMLILMGAQFLGLPSFLSPPKPQPQTTTQVQPGQAPGQVPGTEISGRIPRDAAIAATARADIDTAGLTGSINLMGAQIDDLKLKNYREQADATSPIITLLSPSNTQHAYFVEQGFVPSAAQGVKVPDSKTLWTVAAGSKLTEATPLVLTWDNGAGVSFRREISISEDFLFTVKQSVENKTALAFGLLPYARIQRQETPLVSGYWTFFEGMLGVQAGKLTEVQYKDVAKEGGNIEAVSKGGWLGFTDKYWATSLIPDQKLDVKSSYQHLKQGDIDAYQTDYVTMQPVPVPPGGSANFEDHVFAGVKLVSTIDSIGAKLNIEKYDLMVDWGWFKFLTQPMYSLLHWAKSFLGNFGLAILLVTVLVKAAVFPLASRSYASMSKMKKLQPEMERIKAANPDDRLKQQQETMELYKREKVSPVSGCLPIFVQIPIFFALYKVILTTIELRHAPFYGWIHDLSAPDPTSLFNLFGLIPWSPPHILMLGIWPLLMGVTMWVQMRLNPTPADPVQAQMFNWMPVIFTFMLASMPAGLVIYWTWSNLLSIIQQSYIMKKNGADVNVLGNIRDSIPFLKKKAST